MAQATTEPTTSERVSQDRACELNAPVANGRSIFELYEGLIQGQDHGLLISQDRRRISMFMFDPDRFDIELGLALNAPLAGLEAAKGDADMSRIVLDDGGPGFMSDVSPGVAVVRLTRESLLQGLDHPATMMFGNRRIEPVVQRLSELPHLSGDH